METMVENLWPDVRDIGTTAYLPPVVIMRQQAEIISRMTSNLLEGQVINEKVYLSSVTNSVNRYFLRSPLTGLGEKIETPVVDGSKLRYSFYLRAPALDGAKVHLFEVTHDVALAYPVTFVSYLKNVDSFRNIEVVSESNFIDMLRAFFHSDGVLQVLQSLISQSTGDISRRADG